MRDDERVVLYGTTYQQYVQVSDAFEDRPGLRITYAGGTLEILTPSAQHQRLKKTVTRLVELHALLRDVALYGYGRMTMRNASTEVGLRPHECYCVGTDKDLPDVAIEVVVSRRMNKLRAYAGLGIREVWVHRQGRFEIHQLVDGAYRLAEKSQFFPELDFAELAEYVAMPDQDAAVRAYWARLRGG